MMNKARQKSNGTAGPEKTENWLVYLNSSENIERCEKDRAHSGLNLMSVQNSEMSQNKIKPDLIELKEI